MIYRQDIIYDMKTVRHMSKLYIILTDEALRKAGKNGHDMGKKMREFMGLTD